MENRTLKSGAGHKPDDKNKIPAHAEIRPGGRGFHNAIQPSRVR